MSSIQHVEVHVKILGRFYVVEECRAMENHELLVIKPPVAKISVQRNHIANMECTFKSYSNPPNGNFLLFFQPVRGGVSHTHEIVKIPLKSLQNCRIKTFSEKNNTKIPMILPREITFCQCINNIFHLCVAIDGLTMQITTVI